MEAPSLWPTRTGARSTRHRAARAAPPGPRGACSRRRAAPAADRIAVAVAGVHQGPAAGGLRHGVGKALPQRHASPGPRAGTPAPVDRSPSRGVRIDPAVLEAMSSSADEVHGQRFEAASMVARRDSMRFAQARRRCRCGVRRRRGCDMLSARPAACASRSVRANEEMRHGDRARTEQLSLRSGDELGQAAGRLGHARRGAVAVDRQDRVYVFNRGEHPMIVFDREGNFLRSWGEGVFTRAARPAHRPRRHALLHRRRRSHRAQVHARGQAAARASACPASRRRT